MNSILLDPSLKGLRIGSPEWFQAQRQMIKAKPLVKLCYDLWYRKLLEDADSVAPPYGDRPILELGSGSSYIKDLRPGVITSDVAPGLADRVIDARRLPFEDASLRAILLTHVLHHIPDVERFLAEARRVLVPGGVVSVIDCAHTPFGRFFFSTIHPEPYDPHASSWTFPQSDSMTDSNQALSWIVFIRDRPRLQELFPDLSVRGPEFLPWLGYLLSGGVNLRSFVPPRLARGLAKVDSILRPIDRFFAIHWHLTVRKCSS